MIPTISRPVDVTVALAELRALRRELRAWRLSSEQRRVTMERLRGGRADLLWRDVPLPFWPREASP